MRAGALVCMPEVARILAAARLLDGVARGIGG